MKCGLVIAFGSAIMLVGCSTPQPLFPNEQISMYNWSAGTAEAGGIQFTLYRTYDETLQRYFFVSYATVTDTRNKKFAYHVTSINFHKDSVNLDKLHRLEKYNSGENYLVKRNRKGDYVIKCSWSDEKKYEMNFTSSVPSTVSMFSYHPLPVYCMHTVPGQAGSNQIAEGFKNVTVGQYQVEALYTPGNRKYFEYVFTFDSVTYIFNGYRDSLLKMSSTCLHKIEGDGKVSQKVVGFKVQTTHASDSKNRGSAYPVAIEIELTGGPIIIGGVPPVNQEIRSFKWGAYVGFSVCRMVYPEVNSEPVRNPKIGSLKMVIL